MAYGDNNEQNSEKTYTDYEKLLRDQQADRIGRERQVRDAQRRRVQGNLMIGLLAWLVAFALILYVLLG